MTNREILLSLELFPSGMRKLGIQANTAIGRTSDHRHMHCRRSQTTGKRTVTTISELRIFTQFPFLELQRTNLLPCLLQDRISSLPDDVLHRILSFADSKLAVQTATLSKRWQNVWKGIPVVNFCMDSFPDESIFCLFISQFLRSHEAPKVDRLVFHELPDIDGLLMLCTMTSVIQYVNSRQVQYVDLRNDEVIFPEINNPYHFLFGSSSLKSLELNNFYVTLALKLPSLKTLTLGNVIFYFDDPRENDIPSLNNPLLDILSRCPSLEDLVIFKSVNDMMVHPVTCGSLQFTPPPSNFTSLKTLRLDEVCIKHCDDENHTFDIFSALVSLESLEISDSHIKNADKFIISCPQLVDLKILSVTFEAEEKTKIMVSAPRLASFEIEMDIFSDFEIVLCDVTSLQLVDFHTTESSDSWNEESFHFIVNLFEGLSIAKSLHTTVDIIEALSLFTDMLQSQVCPLRNLETLKVRRMRSEEVEIFQLPSEVIQYLCSGSPKLKEEDVLFE
ncbi:hypothetical protein ACFE04_024853 [Oxalis oulophora]